MVFKLGSIRIRGVTCIICLILLITLAAAHAATVDELLGALGKSTSDSASSPTKDLKEYKGEWREFTAEELKAFIEKNPQMINEKDNKGNTPISTVFYQPISAHYKSLNDPSLLIFLLEKGANPNYNAFTPLHEIYLGQDRYSDSLPPLLEAVTALIKYGGDINAKTDLTDFAYIGWAPIHLYFYSHDSALDPEFKLVTLLLDNGADINAVTKTGLTALHIATRSNNPEGVKFLLARGADPTIRTTTMTYETPIYSTPLEIAKKNNNQEIITLLEEAEAKQGYWEKISNTVSAGTSIVMRKPDLWRPPVISLLLGLLAIILFAIFMIWRHEKKA